MSENRIETFEGILAGDPDHAFARYSLAMEFRRLGQPERALEQFDQLERRHPEYTAGYQMAAQILMELDRMDEAQQRLERGMRCAATEGNARATREMQSMLLEIEEQAR